MAHFLWKLKLFLLRNLKTSGSFLENIFNIPWVLVLQNCPPVLACLAFFFFFGNPPCPADNMLVIININYFHNYFLNLNVLANCQNNFFIL